MITDEDNALKNSNIELDQFNFKKVYIQCQQVQVAMQREAGNDEHMQLLRPMYVNPENQEYFDVENLALRYYSKHENMNGMHCENSLGTTIFGLLMRDVIFDDTVPYVF